jgi:hypothetical protein
MKIINIFLIMLLLSSNNFAQFNQPKQITDFVYDSRNPAFIKYPMNEPYNFPGELFFEAHTDSSINIYSMTYSVQGDSFMQPYPITTGNFQNKNVIGGFITVNSPYKIILWETNQYGNWDIAFAKNFGSGFSAPELFFATDFDELDPSLVMDQYNYYSGELNILFVSNDSVFLYTKVDSTETNFLLFPANDSTRYSNPSGIFNIDGIFYVVAVENISTNPPRLVYKKRPSLTNNWSEILIAYDGYPVQNPKFADVSPSDFYLNFEIIVNGKIKSVLLSPSNFGGGNSDLEYVVDDSTIESSNFDAFSYYIITEHNNFYSSCPYSYKIKDNDSTFIISGSENYWYEYKIDTKISESNIAIGPLSFYSDGIISYTVWEDSSNSHINLFGLKRFDILSDVQSENTLFVNKFMLEQNYPNPFNPSTVISYQLPVTNNVTLKVFDVLGNEIATLVNEEKTAGEYEVEFNAMGLPSGIYFYQLKAGDFIQTKKMILLK